MVEKVFELVKANLKNPKLYVVLFVLIVVALILFPYIDANYFYYNRVEKRINILYKVNELDMEKISQNKVLLEEYNSILDEISKQKDGSLGSVFITKNPVEVNRGKFISGGSISWLLAVVCLFIKFDKKRDKLIGVILFLLIGSALGFVSMILPTVFAPMCNYIAMPLLQLVLVGMLATGSSKSK